MSNNGFAGSEQNMVQYDTILFCFGGFLVVLEFELRALCLLSRCSTTSAFFCFSFLDRVLHFCLGP
jgi:hypothetical protein